MKVTGIVLAAGSSSRFGSNKLLADLDGRPVLQHVLDAVAGAGLADVVVVLGASHASIRAAIEWHGEHVTVNERPQDGLSSSLRVGLDEAALDASAEAVIVVLGDQPQIRAEVISAVVDAAEHNPAPFVRARYARDDAPNPVLVRRGSWARAAGLSGDRGLGPLLGQIPEEVLAVDVGGTNPDVDTPADLSSLAAADLEAAWGERVRANNEQAERLRETETPDFYAPVTNLFVADPRRTGEPALDALIAMADAGETWLDIGAGAGRYALPLALHVREVVAVEPSGGMRRALRAGIAEHGIDNVRVVAGTWPEAVDALEPLPAVDVSLIAHVSYDIEAIGPFLDAMEAASRSRCIALLTDSSPASVADSFWPLVHQESRVPLPALPDLVALLRARGRDPQVEVVERSPRTFDSVEALAAFLRRQLFIAEGGDKDVHFRAILAEHIAHRDGGWTLADRPAGSLGVATWAVGSGR